MSLTVDDPRHGTPNGYSNLDCRCQPCRDAFAARHRDYMDRYPEQRMKHSERQANRRDPDGSKRAAYAARRAAKQAARAQVEARRQRSLQSRSTILNLRTQGMSYRQITEWLEVNQVPTRTFGGRWNIGTVWNIVNNHNGDTA